MENNTITCKLIDLLKLCYGNDIDISEPYLLKKILINDDKSLTITSDNSYGVYELIGIMYDNINKYIDINIDLLEELDNNYNKIKFNLNNNKQKIFVLECNINKADFELFRKNNNKKLVELLLNFIL